MSAWSQDQLRALEAVARAGNFTRAAATLHLSQPALSRRIAALEAVLEATLVVRGRAGVTLTEAGRRVFSFIEAQHALDEDLLGELQGDAASYRGSIRVSGLSSIIPAVVLPGLAPFLREHPAVQLELNSVETDHLATRLAEGSTDLAISNKLIDSVSVVASQLGDEEYVVFERGDGTGCADVFLDTSPSDLTTSWFLEAQSRRVRPKRWSRSFLHDEAGILLGVELGIGRAVKPRHTVPAGAPVRIDHTFTSVTQPVYLLYRRQRYYGRLHRAVRERIERAVRSRLRKPR